MSDDRTIPKDTEAEQGLIGTLTPVKVRALHFIAAYIVAHGCAPTQREIQTEFGFKAVSRVYTILHQLNQAGFISMAPFRGRGIDITAKGMAIIGGNHGTEESTS